MQLILFILIFMAVGYALARTDDRPEDPEIYLKKPNRLASWWQQLFSGRKAARQFRAWVAASEQGLFPQDFKTWLAGLSPSEAAAFTHGLNDYARGLGYDLDQAMQGELKTKPMLMSVFVETIVVYSQAYRKARQVKQESEKKAPQAERQTETSDGKQPAEKSASRRKGDALPAIEAIPAA
jgi:hypothetical protein